MDEVGGVRKWEWGGVAWDDFVCLGGSCSLGFIRVWGVGDGVSGGGVSWVCGWFWGGF